MKTRWLSVALVITTLLLLLGVVPASAAPTGSGGVHIVQRGETLSTIAWHYGLNMWTLARANGIINPNHIYVGQRLVIPGGQGYSGGYVHVVRYGETLSGIAWHYGLNPWTVAQANGIINLNHIYVGQRLVIPGYAPPRQPTHDGPKPKPDPGPAYPAIWPGPWQGQYFDNTSLAGAACTERTDEQIKFDWGYGPPAGCMPSNYFSVRWTGTFHFDEGKYRFYTKVDDGVRVYVDGQLLINGWRTGSTRTYHADVHLAAGAHTVQVEYFEWIQVARMHFWVAKIDGSVTPIGPTDPTDTGAYPKYGWHAEYFNNRGASGEPVVTRLDGGIRFDWGTGSPDPAIWIDGFSARWTTTAHFSTDHYRFCATSDDGVRIYVDGNVVLDEWHPNNGVTFCSAYHVKTGDHKVTVEYYEDGGNALIHVGWEPH